MVTHISLKEERSTEMRRLSEDEAGYISHGEG